MAAIKQRYRIHCQPSGVLGVDRWVTVFIGDPTPAQKRKQKGLWYTAFSKEAAERIVEALLEKAQEACVTGKAQLFINHWNTRLDHQRKTLTPPEWP